MPFVSLPARGLETFYEAEGDGAPVVLIGGFTSTLETWDRQAPALAERFHVVRPDNRGSGRTRILADDGQRSPRIWAEDTLALIDALKLDRVHLVGCSMGGMIAQAFAAAWPERLRTLTLFCTTLGGAQAIAGSPEMARGLAAGSAPDASPADREALASAALHPDTQRDNPEAWAYFLKTRTDWPHSREELARRRAGLAGFSVWDRLGALDVPTLVSTGVGDRLVPPENSRVLAERIPGAELRFIEAGGHVFFMEQPAAVNAMLLDFLSRHEG